MKNSNFVITAEEKPSAVPSTVPTPQPNSPQPPAQAPETTHAPAAPETKGQGSIGQAISANVAQETSYKP